MSTPVAENRRKDQQDAMNAPDNDDDVQMKVDADVKDALLNYKENKQLRDSLRRSIAKNTMGAH